MSKNKVNKSYDVSRDPKKDEESQKYENPIPSRDFIIQFLQDYGIPVSFEVIAKNMHLKSEEQSSALKRRLKAMERDGQILYNRRGFYGLVEKMDLVRGVVMASKEGPGEVLSDTGRSIGLSSSQMRSVFHGDKVIARPSGINAKGKLVGQIVEILARNTHELTGRFYTELGVSYVVPVNTMLKHDVLVLPNSDQNTIEEGTLVKVSIISQPSFRTQPVGRIKHILGSQDSTEEAINMAIKTHNLSTQWPDSVQKLVNEMPDAVTPSEFEARYDLRHLPFVTIDGEDAKDFDDAIYAETKKSGGWRVYVAIADVSNYVKVASQLDLEARNRSTSVYFPGHVIPMLPEKLSNHLCSLKPNVDRLALVCEMTVSQKGRLSGYKFYCSVIRSKARLTYTEVAGLLEESNYDFYQKYPELAPHIFDLYGLYLMLNEQRQARGAIDFDTIETQFELNENYEIKSILPRARNDAHRLIEECMLLANQAAARFIIKHKQNAPFRIHEGPMANDVSALKEYLKTQGLGLQGGDDPQPLDYARLLQQAKQHKNFDNIQLVTLRSMNQAIYSPDNEGHFGLALKAYTHFTSPIRRYPDLIVHRIIKYMIGEKKQGGHQYTKEALYGLCDHASVAERRADSASKDVEEWLKCNFMQHRIGEVFEAVIVKVTGFGFFVQLKENYIQGLIHIASLEGEYFHFDPVRYMLIGEHTRTIYQMGDHLTVKLIRVDMSSFKIDFEIAQNTSISKPSKKKTRSTKRTKTNKDHSEHLKQVALKLKKDKAMAKAKHSSKKKKAKQSNRSKSSDDNQSQES